MNLSVSDLVLAAKEREIEELRHLASKAELVGVLGHMIHALQSERGASSVFLASDGCRFGQIRLAQVAEAEVVEGKLRACFTAQLNSPAFGNARLFSLMAWALLGLDQLAALRAQIAARELKADAAILAFSRLISGLVSLIFEVADAAVDPEVSRSLVALFNFIQGKEFAGQERAVGGLCFASGLAEAGHQQRLLHLIEAQEKSFQTFAEFADPKTLAHWGRADAAPCVLQVERMRRTLISTKVGGALDATLSDKWFSDCSERLSLMWAVQCDIVAHLRELCAERIRVARQNLADSEGLIRSLVAHPPSELGMLERFFDPELPVDHALRLLPGEEVGKQLGHSLLSLLQAQSTHLARMEGELEQARKALNERKTVERAKGVLMAHLSLSEEEAYRMLRKTAMDQNRRLIDVAEATLSLPLYGGDWSKAHQN